jgi:hypothetical protein
MWYHSPHSHQSNGLEAVSMSRFFGQVGDVLRRCFVATFFKHFPHFLPSLGFDATFRDGVRHNYIIRVKANGLKVPPQYGM